MWNKSISLPVKKNDPTINDNGIMMEETYEFIGGIPADFRDSTRDDEVLRNRMVIPQTRLLRSWRVIILENHSWWMSLQVKFTI